VVVEIAVGLHPEELRGEVLAILGVPARHTHQRRVFDERTPRMLVHADGDANVVIAQPDTVGTRLRRARRGRTRVEDIGERDAGQSDHAHDCVGVGHRPAAAHTELDVLPLDAGIGDRGEDRVGAHLHRRLPLEPPERM
jgi:hypothetical protein